MERRRYARIARESIVAVDRDDRSAQLAHTLDLSASGIRFLCVGVRVVA